MKKIAVIIGTRPEAIKMAPVVCELAKNPGVELKLVSTGQHKEILYQALEVFGLKPDHDLDVLTPGQSLSALTAKILTRLDTFFNHYKADLVLGHGDTSTCFAAAVSSVYHRVPFFHVEAGLRSYNLDSPFPEEFNRQSVAHMAAHHFAPNDTAENTLLREGIQNTRITNTHGSTIVDALRALGGDTLHKNTATHKQQLLLTLHRRELGLGTQLEDFLDVIGEKLKEHPNSHLFFPLHPNPRVRQLAEDVFKNMPNVELSPALPYGAFIRKLQESSLILTDSGGVQEEAALLGKSTLLLRGATEREDGMNEGHVKLVGQNALSLKRALEKALQEKPRGQQANLHKFQKKSPAKIIAHCIKEKLSA